MDGDIFWLNRIVGNGIQILNWILENILTLQFFIQLVVIAVVFGLARHIVMPWRGKVAAWVQGKTDEDDPWLRRLGNTADNLAQPLVWLLFLWGLVLLSWFSGHHWTVIHVVASLLTIWIVIQLLSSIIVNKFWRKVFALSAWSLVAISILGLLKPTAAFLESISFTVGKTQLTAYKIVKAVLLSIGTLWVAFSLSHMLQSKLLHIKDLTPSARLLIGKMAKIFLIFLAIMISLNVVGIDLTALAVFSGALGIGIGFGLQKVVANFISGIILLMDRSIRPSDVIEIGGTQGRVKSLGARYTSVVTRDGTEYLIPNENLITQEVINWSYSDTNVRRKISIGISYDSDVELARRLVLDAAMATKRIISYPAPVCHLKSFGDNSVDLEARFWISDPENGLMNVQSDFLRKVWQSFHEHNIDIPFPQRDLNIRGGKPIDINILPVPGQVGQPAKISSRQNNKNTPGNRKRRKRSRSKTAGQKAQNIGLKAPKNDNPS